MKYTNFAFLDIETSGASFRSDRIIEIGILRVENNQLVKTYQTLINPQTYVSPFIEDMTGIRKESLESAPIFSEIKNNILEMVEDCILVAHNVRFDYGFLKREYAFLEHTFSMKQCCTVKLSRLLYPHHRHHNLDALINRFGFECKNRHRAFDDAKVLWDFFQYAQKEYTEVVFEKALHTVMKRPSLPTGVPAKTIDSLPETPGVYIFYGENNMPLYVGKSINIRERVLSHFAADHSSATEMKITQQIQHIETIPTAGELGALFTEANLVKTMQPLYNRQLRNSRKLLKLVKKETQEGYQSVHIETVTTISADEIPSIVGIFKSKKQVEEFLFSSAKQNSLCHKLLGIEKTKTGCFAYRLGQCKGACVNKELALAYNMRFIMAFSEKKIKQWPFNGPIVIEEYNEEIKKREKFVIDKWCYLGSASSMEDSINFLSLRRGLRSRGEVEKVDSSLNQNYSFDYDLYKILCRYLLDKKNYKYVKQLQETKNELRSMNLSADRQDYGYI